MNLLNPALLWALPGLPAVVGTVLCLTRFGGRRAVSTLAISTAAATTALAVWALRTRPEVAVPFVLGSDFALQVDALAGATALGVGVVAVLVLLFAAVDVRRSPARFHGLMLLFVGAVMATVTATTLPTLLVAWEIMGATSFALIGFSWNRPATMPAATVAFVTTRAADLGLYLATGAALAAGTGLGLAELGDAEPGWRTVIAVGIAVAALGKAAQLPFSFWLSGAMEGPSAVSALLHSAAMVAMGGFLLLRVPELLGAEPAVASAVAWVGALTALALGVVAVAQRDLKQLLAASTAAQLGFVVLAAGLGATTAGASQLLSHAATKALLFLTAGAWLTALDSKQLASLRGVARRWRVVGVTATVGLLSLAGVAPLSLWASKEAVLAEALHASPVLYAVGLAGAVVSAAYAGKVLATIWAPASSTVAGHGVQPRRSGESAHVPKLAWLPMLVLAAAAAGLGLMVVPPVAKVLQDAFGDPDATGASVLELGLSGALALAVVAAVWRWQLPEPRWARSWLGLQAAARLLVVTPTYALARSLARFDDRILDGGVDAVARGGMAAGRRSRRVDDHGIDAAVRVTARSVRGLGRLAQRPQTGQLHHYYAQSAVLLGAAVLLLVMVR